MLLPDRLLRTYVIFLKKGSYHHIWLAFIFCMLKLMTPKVQITCGIMESTLSIATYFAWWRHQMETFSALLAICAGNSPVPGEFPAQRPVTQSFDVFFDLCPNKRLSKQSWGWWVERPSGSLWRHSNELTLTQMSYTAWRHWTAMTYISWDMLCTTYLLSRHKFSGVNLPSFRRGFTSY